MNTIEAPTIDAGALTLHELDFDPEPECDYALTDCYEVVAWRVTCTLCGGWGMLCEEHAQRLIRTQRHHAHRRGMSCPSCHGIDLDIMRFDPIISADVRKLW